MVQAHPLVQVSLRTLAAVAMAAAALAMTDLLWTWTRQTAMLFPLAAVAVAAWTLGLWPALAAAFVAAVGAEYFLLEPRHQLAFSVDDVLRVAILTAVAGLVASLSAREREAVRATRQAHRHLELLTDSLPVLIGYVDRDQRYRFTNRAYGDWFGRPQASIRGQTIRQLVGDDAYAILRPNIEAALSGQVVSFEQQLTYGDGTERVVLATYVPELDADDGQVKGFAIMVADVSERRRAEAALRASEEKFHVMADSAPVMVWITDEAHRCTWLNQPWLDFTGRTMEQELGLGWIESIHADDRDRCVEVFRRSTEARAEFTMEYRLRRHDGEYRWMIDTGRPLRDADGRFTGFVGSCIDITDRKAHEEEREHLLASERHARGEAERVSRLKDDFLATLSHELRTPLNAILGWAQVLRTAASDPAEVLQGLEIIERNARSQTQIISDLLDMSRIMSGKVELQVEQADLQVLLHTAVQTVQHSAEAKQIRIERQIDPGVGPIAADPGRLQQVVWNLLTNAIKFTPRGGLVTVALRGAEQHAELQVTDSGQGIAPEFLPHVFERFRQADASSTRKHGGLGLGLSIAKSIVEMHGGVIQAESGGIGKGARFTITLPVTAGVARHAQAAGRPWMPPRRRSDTEPPKLDGVKVLAIDDEADSRDLMKRLLCEHGAEVVTAAGANEALTLLNTHPFDVLLSDIGMPDRDGYDLIRELRAGASTPNARIPAAAVTAFARSEDRTRALLNGYQSFVAKPFEPSELVAVVASLSETFRDRG